VQGGLIRDHQPAFAGDEVLGGVKAEGGHVAHRPGVGPVVGRLDGVGAVLDQGEAVPGGDLPDQAHLAGLAGVVDDHHRLGARGDGVGDRRRVDVAGERVDVDEDGGRPDVDDDVGRGHEGHRRGDHLVARPDAQGVQGEVQTGRAGVEGDGIRDPQVVCHQALEPLRARTGAQPARPQGRYHFGDLVVTDQRGAVDQKGDLFGDGDCGCHRTLLGH
jgi:hypothetical protein